MSLPSWYIKNALSTGFWGGGADFAGPAAEAAGPAWDIAVEGAWENAAEDPVEGAWERAAEDAWAYDKGAWYCADWTVWYVCVTWAVGG